MTDKQKESIRILNRLKEPVIKMGDVIREAAISKEEYFLLLEFIVGNEPQMTYIPYQPTITPQHLDPRVAEVCYENFVKGYIKGYNQRKKEERK